VFVCVRVCQCVCVRACVCVCVFGCVCVTLDTGKFKVEDTSSTVPFVSSVSLMYVLQFAAVPLGYRDVCRCNVQQ